MEPNVENAALTERAEAALDAYTSSAASRAKNRNRRRSDPRVVPPGEGGE